MAKEVVVIPKRASSGYWHIYRFIPEQDLDMWVLKAFCNSPAPRTYLGSKFIPENQGWVASAERIRGELTVCKACDAKAIRVLEGDN